MDVALALHLLVPSAKYGGVLVENNKDSYAALAWNDKREKPTWEEIVSVVIPELVPESISALGGLLTLDAAGLSSAYQAWALDPSRTFAERAFIDKAMTWKRQDPVILAAADAMGLTSEQVDALFIQAGQQ
jgi:hypothetical protein